MEDMLDKKLGDLKGKELLEYVAENYSITHVLEYYKNLGKCTFAYESKRIDRTA